MLKLDVSETMQAQSFAAYMMAAGCFGSSVCTTPQMEERILSLMDKKDMHHLGLYSIATE